MSPSVTVGSETGKKEEDAEAGEAAGAQSCTAQTMLSRLNIAAKGGLNITDSLLRFGLPPRITGKTSCTEFALGSMRKGIEAGVKCISEFTHKAGTRGASRPNTGSRAGGGVGQRGCRCAAPRQAVAVARGATSTAWHVAEGASRIPYRSDCPAKAGLNSRGSIRRSVHTERPDGRCGG